MPRNTDTNTDGDDRIDQELACLHGHEEARQRLADHGWPEEDIETLESSMTFTEFARAVADEVRWRRDRQSA